MSSRKEGEHRIREEYREPLGYGVSSRGFGIGQAAFPALIAFLVLFIATILGVWMLVHWLMTDAWNTHPMAVLILYALLSIAATFWCIAWPIYKAIEEFKLHKLATRAKIFALNTNTAVTRINAEQHGFNAEYVEGAFAQRSINPLSIAQASKETNNFFGRDSDGEEGEEDEEEDFVVPTLLDQLNDGTTGINEATSIVGYVDGEPLRGKLFARSDNLFDSLFALGDQGFGKSSLGVLIACYTVLHGGKILVIDPDAEEPESLTRRLGRLSKFFMRPVASTSDQALRVTAIAKEAIESPSGKPVLLLVDEFSYIMRQLENKSSSWNEAAIQIKDIAEDYATRGRKRFCRIVAFGQIAKQERTGGTEFRDSCTLMAFHLKKDRAQQILETDAAEVTSQLVAGEVVVVPRNAGGQAYKLAIPYADDEAVERVIEMVGIETVTVRPVLPDVDCVESDFGACTDGFIDAMDDTVELPELYTHNFLGNDGILGPVEPTHKDARYTLDAIKIEMFCVAYRITGNMDESLKQVGANSRYRDHARQIIAERDLKRKGA